MSNAVDALKAKLAAVKGEKKVETKPEKTAPTASKKAAPPKKPEKKPAKKPVKKAKKPEKKAPKKAAPKKATKSAARTFDRDRKGDGLRPIERKLISIVKSAGGTMKVIDIARKIFGTNVKDEGPNSIRTIRNGVRKPIEYGLMKWHGRGEVKLASSKAPAKKNKK